MVIRAILVLVQECSVQNRYFALPDRQVTPYQQNDAIPAPLEAWSYILPIHKAMIRHQPVSLWGWYVNLDQAQQEQVFGNGYVVAGKVWFTSFVPAGHLANGQPSIGVTRLYQIDLVSGAFSGATAFIAKSDA